MVSWNELENYCNNCNRCKLAKTRTNVVIGDGSKNAAIMFIGEGPGEQEDLQGLPFVGPAGQLFDKMLAAIDLDRSKVYICNVVKCRPPRNRDPEDDEKTACLPLLRAQVSLIKPKIIVCLGRIAAKEVIKPDFRITREHGIWEERKGYWLSATYHPSALLRDPAKKRESWEDLKKLQQKIIELGIIDDYGKKAENTEAEKPQKSAIPVIENLTEYYEEDHLEAGKFPESDEKEEAINPFDDIDFSVDVKVVSGVTEDDDEPDLTILGF